MASDWEGFVAAVGDGASELLRAIVAPRTECLHSRLKEQQGATEAPDKGGGVVAIKLSDLR
jgi:hypothetical protein